jgi:hypothetical protein
LHIEAREGKWCRFRIDEEEFIGMWWGLPVEAEVVEIARGWCVRVCEPDAPVDDTLVDWTGVFAGHDTAVDYMKELLGGVHG